jgi:hypothetical protein
LGDSIHLLTDLTTTNLSNFFVNKKEVFKKIKKEDSSPKENMKDITHINLLTALLALYPLNFAFEF